MKLGRKIGVIYAAVIIVLITMSGCGKDKQETDSASADEYIYVAEYQNISDEGSYIQNFIFGKDDFMYYREDINSCMTGDMEFL